MKLSVMPVYNREKYVGAALRSLLRQRDAADLDIIVVDDGSTDGSADIVRTLMGEVSCIRLFSQANAGATKARNSGLRQLLPQTSSSGSAFLRYGGASKWRSMPPAAMSPACGRWP